MGKGREELAHQARQQLVGQVRDALRERERANGCAAEGAARVAEVRRALVQQLLGAGGEDVRQLGGEVRARVQGAASVRGAFVQGLEGRVAGGVNGAGGALLGRLEGRVAGLLGSVERASCAVLGAGEEVARSGFGFGGCAFARVRNVAGASQGVVEGARRRVLGRVGCVERAAEREVE